jgi:hypothetical protein
VFPVLVNVFEIFLSHLSGLFNRFFLCFILNP